MIICSVCVGEEYSKRYSSIVKKHAPKNHKLIILTDFPQYFDFCQTELYTEDIFSYFIKNIFTSEICEKYKTGILYIDIDSFHIVDIKKINSSDFLYDKLWNEYPYSKLNELPKPLLEFYKISGNMEIENIHEKVFYLPYSTKIEKLKTDLIGIKEIWDKETQTSDPKGNAKKYSKYGIGYGEGIPFSLALIMNGIITKKYKFTKSNII